MTAAAGARALVRVSILVALSWAGGAHAWDKDVHVAIIEAALRLSPALVARIPDGSVTAIEKAAGEADALDPSCRSHRGGRSDLEAAHRAAKMLAELRTPRRDRTARAEATLLGQYLHYVADCAAPRAAFAERSSRLPLAAYDLVLYRERRTAEPSVEDSLKQRTLDSLWADPVDAAAPRSFRDAVNATVDAGLLLPQVSPGPPVVDEGPVLFSLVQTLSVRDDTRAWQAMTETDDEAHRKWAEELLELTPARDQSVFLRLMKKGVHVVEWVPHTGADGTRVRVLLFNNQRSCAYGIHVQSGKASFAVDANVAAFSVKTVEVLAPPFPPGDIGVAARRGWCAEDEGGQSVSAAWSRVWMRGQQWLPSWVMGREVRVPLARRSGRGFDVAFEDDLVKTVPGLEIRSFLVRDTGNAWEFEIETSTHVGWIPRPLALRVEVTDPAAGRTTKDLRVNPEGRAKEPGFLVTVPERTSRFRAPKFRLVSLDARER